MPFSLSSSFLPINCKIIIKLIYRGVSMQQTTINLKMKFDVSAATPSLFLRGLVSMMLFVRNFWRRSFRPSRLLPLKRECHLQENVLLNIWRSQRPWNSSGTILNSTTCRDINLWVRIRRHRRRRRQ